jgi:hypothetical protein
MIQLLANLQQMLRVTSSWTHYSKIQKCVPKFFAFNYLSSSLIGSTLMCLDLRPEVNKFKTIIVMVDIADGAAQESDRPLSSILYYTNVPKP